MFTEPGLWQRCPEKTGENKDQILKQALRHGALTLSSCGHINYLHGLLVCKSLGTMQ